MLYKVDILVDLLSNEGIGMLREDWDIQVTGLNKRVQGFGRMYIPFRIADISGEDMYNGENDKKVVIVGDVQEGRDREKADDRKVMF